MGAESAAGETAPVAADRPMKRPQIVDGFDPAQRIDEEEQGGDKPHERSLPTPVTERVEP